MSTRAERIERAAREVMDRYRTDTPITSAMVPLHDALALPPEPAGERGAFEAWWTKYDGEPWAAAIETLPLKDEAPLIWSSFDMREWAEAAWQARAALPEPAQDVRAVAEAAAEHMRTRAAQQVSGRGDAFDYEVTLERIRTLPIHESRDQAVSMYVTHALAQPDTARGICDDCAEYWEDCRCDPEEAAKDAFTEAAAAMHAHDLVCVTTTDEPGCAECCRLEDAQVAAYDAWKAQEASDD